MVVAEKPEPVVIQPSSYLKYLPGVYAQSEFMGQFLLIFESILGPIEEVIDNLAYYFDPGMTTEELLPWLASWVNLVLDETWPLERRRELVKFSVELFRWRGTRRGLLQYLRVYSGVEPQIIEHYGGVALGPNARLGRTTVIGDGEGPHTFTVKLELEDTTLINLDQLKAIIESEKPAHAGYNLQIVHQTSQEGHQQ